MNLEKTFHSLSHLKWIFLIVQIFLIVYCFLWQPAELLSLIGVILFAAGIYLGLDSLSDQNRMTEIQLKRYSDAQFADTQSKFTLAAILVVMLISLLFVSLKFLLPERDVFNQLFDLGVDCWGLVLGLICFLKSNRDKAALAAEKIGQRN